MKPKLFKYRLDTTNKTSKYEFSSIELHQDLPIFTDYNMGVRVDLVDRDIYAVNPSYQKAALLASGQQNITNDEVNQKLVEELRQTLLTEKDKFLLSDRDSVPQFTSSVNKTEGMAQHAKLLKE